MERAKKYHFQKISGKANSVKPEIVNMLERKPHYQLYCPAMTWRTSSTLTSLDYSTNVWQLRLETLPCQHANSNQKNAHVES